jgi:amino acid transporter
MSPGEYLSFAVYFGFLVLMTILAYKGAHAPKKFLDSRWGKSMRRKTSAKQLQRICTLLLIGGILLLGFSIWQLSNGAFKLKGNPKSYGFSDFWK